MAINTTGFTQAKTIYVDFDQERKPLLRDIGSDQIGANGAKLISFGFGSESLAGYTVVLETKRVADGGLKYAIAETYTDNSTTRYKVPITEWFTTYRSALIMAVKVFNNNGVTIVDGEITTVDNDYLISVSDTFTLTVNYAPKATAVVPSFSPSELELILSAIAGKQDTANSIVVLQEEDALPDVSDGTKNGWTYLKKDDEGFFRVYQVIGSTLYQTDITVNRIRLDASYTQLPTDIGEMVWSQEHRTYLLKVTDEVFLEYGQELVFDSKASGSVPNGFPIIFVEPQGDHAISKVATATDVLANPYGLRGIATETVANNEFFKSTQLGRVDGIDTRNFVTENGGTILYFDIEETGTGAYNMTTIKPSKPNPVIKLGSIEKFSTGSSANGRIIVRVDYGESLQTLHDVDISGAITGDILRKTNGVWHNSDSLTEAESDIVDLQGEIADIKSGTTIVKKAEQDKNGNDIVDTYATKADTYTKIEVDNKVASVYKYKGSVDTFDDLPSTGLTTGDVYNVIDSGINYAWTGSAWDDIGGVEALATASNNGLMSKEDFSKLLALYDKTTLDGLLDGKVDKTTTVNGKALSGNITLDKTDVGLGNVDNTSDANKSISTATQTALDLKADKVVLTNLVTNGDFSNGTTGWALTNTTGTVNAGVYEFIATTSNGQLNKTAPIMDAVANTKIYFFAYYKTDSALTYLTIPGSNVNSFHTGNNAYQLVSGIWNNTAYSGTYGLRISDSRTSLWTTIYVDYTGTINLTYIFGAGNEPTKEQMDAIMALKGGYFSTATLNIIDVMKLYAQKTQEAWLTPTLTTSTTTYLKYRKDTLGTIIVEGNLTVGTAGTNFTLPTGYRPLFTYVVGDLTFNTNGTVVSASTGLKYINVRFASI